MPIHLGDYWFPVTALTIVTFFSRILLFSGVKNVGGMQTAILGLSELLITIILAHLWLGENMTVVQWIGAALLGVSIFLISREPPPPPRSRAGGWFSCISATPTQPMDILKDGGD
jgi:drug/metabolite transporter (DMT)-like permease